MSTTTTGIEWTDRTWNPVRGCTRVSEGCRNCYAERIAARFSGAAGQPFHGFAEAAASGPRWTGRVELVASALFEPLKWRRWARKFREQHGRRPRVFVNSMSDLFHEGLPDEHIDDIFEVMENAPEIDFQVLTKRPERMREYCSERHCLPPNVWLGVSVEDQKTANERIPLLLQIAAAVRFVSYEPALGPVDFTDLDMWQHVIPYLQRRAVSQGRSPDNYPESIWVDCLTGRNVGNDNIGRIDWVIAGGESGPGARPAHPDWFRAVRDQCAEAGVPFFFKQWGDWAPADNERAGEIAVWPDGRSNDLAGTGETPMARLGKKGAGRLLDGREHSEFPEAK